MLTRKQVDTILKAHGILDVFDISTGSSLAGDLGNRRAYTPQEIYDWLGY